MSMKEDGIHRVPVPGTPVTAVAILVLIAAVLMQWPPFRWVALVSLGLGFLVAGALILKRRRERGTPPAARLNFPTDQE